MNTRPTRTPTRILWDRQTALLEVDEPEAARRLGPELLALTDFSPVRRAHDRRLQARRRAEQRGEVI